ncbi:restriction endonuclease subunit S [Amycolatopsis sp. NPDC051102]|uniref:restriction endonuclease subunit S n=1 Tax=Amycolatopsis sp. NPDC051102 TaxID=3155163 RepID=UPI0034192BAD
MSDLPPGWEWATLGELGEWYGGGTPSKRNPEYWTDGIIPWLSPKDMGWDKLARTRDKISEAALTGSSARLVPENSVAIVVRSGILERRLPIAVVPFETTLNQDMRAVVPYDGVDHSWLAYFLRSAEAQILKECSKRGTTVASIDVPSLMRLRVPMAPRQEQKRVVAVLEAQLSRLNAGNDYVLMARERYARSRDAATMAALRGELVEASTGEMSIRDFMALLSAVRQEKVSRRRRIPIPMSQSPDLGMPNRWAVTSLDSLCWDIQYGTSAKATADESGDVIPVIRMGNIQDGGLVKNSLKYLSVDHPDVAGLRLVDGDVLFNRTNSLELVGKTAAYRRSFGPATFASYLIRCRLLPQVNPDWIALVINSPIGRKYVKSVASQQVGQANVNGTKLAAMPIPLPPPGEQERIVAAVGELLESLERGASVADAVVTRGNRLRRSLLVDAFSGRLVPQDPNDEPASVLLERIRALRAAQPKRGRTRRAKNTNQETLL